MLYKCPKCSDEIYDRVRFCPKCGLDFTAALRKCPKCRSQVPKESKDCPECGLNFEQWEFLFPKIIVFGSLIIVIAGVIIFPYIWRMTPFFHPKAVITSGFLSSDVSGTGLVPLFLDWRTGERYLILSAKRSGITDPTEYMYNLVPLPPEIAFHYDIQTGEKVYVLGRHAGSGTNEWIEIGRYTDKPIKTGWVHSSNIKILQ